MEHGFGSDRRASCDLHSSCYSDREPAVVCADPDHDFVVENVAPAVAVVYTASALLVEYVVPAPVVSSSRC